MAKMPFLQRSEVQILGQIAEKKNCSLKSLYTAYRSKNGRGLKKISEIIKIVFEQNAIIDSEVFSILFQIVVNALTTFMYGLECGRYLLH